MLGLLGHVGRWSALRIGGLVSVGGVLCGLRGFIGGRRFAGA